MAEDNRSREAHKKRGNHFPINSYQHLLSQRYKETIGWTVSIRSSHQKRHSTTKERIQRSQSSTRRFSINFDHVS